MTFLLFYLFCLVFFLRKRPVSLREQSAWRTVSYCIADDSHETSILIRSEKKKTNLFQNVTRCCSDWRFKG